MSDRGSPLSIVAVAGDAGGASALAPVLQALSSARFDVEPLAYRQAVSLWDRRGLSPQSLDESLSVLDARDILHRRGAALLLTATSVNGVELENRFIAAAREIPIPSVAVLDFWSNYARRFSREDGDLYYLPDRIAVMDQQARAEMVAEGFDPSRLVITGQPAFDDLGGWREGASARREARRSSLGVLAEDLLVFFASQPLAAGLEAGSSQALHPGYDERTVLPLLIAALERIAARTARRIVLAIRPHPREDHAWLRTLTGSRVVVVVNAQGEGRDWALAADLVTGMTSVLLVEACLLGCITVSLQPGLCLPDPLPTNRSGMSVAIHRASEIEPVIETLLLNDGARREAMSRAAALRHDGMATCRVVELVRRVLKCRQADKGETDGAACR